jgi:hypothetical protein
LAAPRRRNLPWHEPFDGRFEWRLLGRGYPQPLSRKVLENRRPRQFFGVKDLDHAKAPILRSFSRR